MDVVRRLLDATANVNATATHRITPLQMAESRTDMAGPLVVQWLLDAKADPDIKAETPRHEMWDCHMCTVGYDADAEECDMCGETRIYGDELSLGPTMADALGEEWECSFCTTLNEAADEECAMCGSEQPDAPGEQASTFAAGDKVIVIEQFTIQAKQAGPSQEKPVLRVGLTGTITLMSDVAALIDFDGIDHSAGDQPGLWVYNKNLSKLKKESDKNTDVVDKKTDEKTDEQAFQELHSTAIRTSWKDGDRVEALYKGKWFEGKIIEDFANSLADDEVWVQFFDADRERKLPTWPCRFNRYGDKIRPFEITHEEYDRLWQEVRDELEWECEVCGTMNNMHFGECEMCDSARPLNLPRRKDDDPPPPEPDFRDDTSGDLQLRRYSDEGLDEYRITKDGAEDSPHTGRTVGRLDPNDSRASIRVSGNFVDGMLGERNMSTTSTHSAETSIDGDFPLDVDHLTMESDDSARPFPGSTLAGSKSLGQALDPNNLPKANDGNATRSLRQRNRE